jgi:hypothetical protein
MTTKKVNLDEKTAKFVVSDAISESGEIDVDIVTGILYSRFKLILKETLDEVTEEFTKALIKKGVDKKYLVGVKTKYTVISKKQITAEELCRATIKRTGKQCDKKRKEGAEYCGVHNKGKAGHSYDERSGISSIEESPARGARGVSPTRPKARSTTSAVPDVPKRRPGATYTATKDEPPPPIELKIEEIDGIPYVMCKHEVYEIPSDFDPNKEYDPANLKLAGTKRKNGEIMWLSKPEVDIKTMDENTSTTSESDLEE